MKTKKKTIVLILIILAVLIISLYFIFCFNKLNGTYYISHDLPVVFGLGREYRHNENVRAGLYIFNGNKITFTVGGWEHYGTYKIRGKEIIIKFIDDYYNESDEIIYSFEKKGRTIIIDGHEFTKVTFFLSWAW